MIYYAGHGIELDGTNYLIPVDATLETDGDVWTRPFRSIGSCSRSSLQAASAGDPRCLPRQSLRQDNEADHRLARDRARSCQVEPTSPNTMIAFAAKAGSTASDGDSKNSPFAAALVEHLPKPGLDLRRAFGFVRDDVLKNTGNKQEPYVYGSLGGNDVPLVPAKPAATGPQADPQAAVRRDYELALQLGDRDGWEAFLRNIRTASMPTWRRGS